MKRRTIACTGPPFGFGLTMVHHMRRPVMQSVRRRRGASSMVSSNPYEPSRIDQVSNRGISAAPFPLWLKCLWIASSLLHGFLAVILTISQIRAILIVAGVLRGFVGRDPKVWVGIIFITALSWCASIAAWQSRNHFARTPICVAAVAAFIVVVSGLFIVPLHEAWVGFVNVAIASGALWITAVLAWYIHRPPNKSL